MNEDNSIQGTTWISAADACRKLGIKRQTLYAYVSRGLIRSEAGPARARRYRVEDVVRLELRSAARAGHAAVASGALVWGEPVLDTAISGIGPEGPHYRGRSALELARAGTRFEVVAEWLWSGVWNDEVCFDGRMGFDVRRASRLVPEDAHPLDRLMVALSLSAATNTATDPRALVRMMAASLALDRANEHRVSEALRASSIAEAVLTALGTRVSPRAVRAIDLALVLIADHELNSSTFAARIAAGTGADLRSCVLSALATLKGPLHGGSCDRIEALLAEAREPEDALRVLRERMRRGEGLPGFGHRLYPAGDPRTPPLLTAAFEMAPHRKNIRKLRAFIDAVALLGGENPTVDLGLVAIASALGMPKGSGALLMAMGRAAGWIAHAIEQKELGVQLRPRSRYVAQGLPSLSP